jgi:hypothetical protein
VSSADPTGPPGDQVPSAPHPQHQDDARTGIIRRHPTGANPVVGSDPQTSIIRRHPTGAIPTVGNDPPTSYIEPPAAEDGTQTSYIPRPRPVEIPATTTEVRPGSAIAAAVLSVLAGWATAVIATDLITGWWHTDRLFCVAVGFLTAISAAATIGGVIALLLRRRMGRLLIVVGCVIGLLIFASLFLAGAKFGWIVYAIPVLPLSAIAATLLPGTGRWSRTG